MENDLLRVFFQICSGFDEVELLDPLLHRYHSLNEIKELDIETGPAPIEKAKEKEKDERISCSGSCSSWAMAISSEVMSLEDYRNSGCRREY